MSPYEIVNLIRTIERYDPDLIPFIFDEVISSFQLICVKREGAERVKFHTPWQWFYQATERGIKLPDEAFNLFTGVDDVRDRQKAFRA